MKTLLAALMTILLFSLTGCTMFSSWKSIPPPGGCDQCHSLPIGHKWKALYNPVTLSRHDNTEVFQTPDYNMPQTDKPLSKMEIQKLEEAQCFDCHRSPSPAHKERKGKFHH